MNIDLRTDSYESLKKDSPDTEETMHNMMKMIETGEDTFFCITLSALNKNYRSIFHKSMYLNFYTTSISNFDTKLRKLT